MADTLFERQVPSRATRDSTAWDRLKVHRDWLGMWFMLPAAAFLLLANIVRIGLGYWPAPVAVLESFPLVGQFAGGYGGLKLTQIDPLACLILPMRSWS